MRKVRRELTAERPKDKSLDYGVVRLLAWSLSMYEPIYEIRDIDLLGFGWSAR